MSVLFALFLFFIVLGFYIFGFFEIEDHAIDAIAKAGGGRTVFKYVSEVGLAAAALHFGAVHAVAVVGQIDDAGFADGSVEAGPTAAAFKFSIAFKEGIAAGGTEVGAYFLRMLEGAGARPFGAFLACYVVHVLGQNFFPFFIGEFDPAGIGAGINGVGGIFFVIAHNCFFRVVA